MTKEEVRVLALSRLRLTRKAVLYDIGAGTGSVTVEARGKFQLEGGTIYRCTTSEHGGAVLLKGEESPGYTTFDMKGGRIYFCQTIGAWSSCHGGAIYGSTAQVQLSNCAVDSCYSEDSGGGIYLNEGYLRLLGVKMVGNPFNTSNDPTMVYRFFIERQTSLPSYAYMLSKAFDDPAINNYVPRK